MRLTATCNELKWILSVSGGFGLLQMISKPDTGRCVNEDTKPIMEVDCEIPSGNITRMSQNGRLTMGLRLLQIESEPDIGCVSENVGP